MSVPPSTVTIPCRRYARYPAEAIDSVLAQTRPADEVLVMDVGSQDATANVIDRYDGRVRRVPLSFMDIYPARQIALELARFEFFP